MWLGNMNEPKIVRQVMGRDPKSKVVILFDVRRTYRVCVHVDIGPQTCELPGVRVLAVQKDIF
jgi:hypothetical protein